jgi:alpha-tubulin suppressor-like RCC1 family protein
MIRRIIATRPWMVVSRQRIGGGIRLYSKIDEFNKSKTSYNYGHNFLSLEELEPTLDPETTKRKLERQLEEEAELQEQIDINSIIENDPRLQLLVPNSPEYKEELHKLNQEYQQKQKKQKSRFEFNERMKGVALGVLLLFGIISGHQIFMNYQYLKTSLLADYLYKIDEDNHSDISDPDKNKKKLGNMMANVMLQLTGQNIANLKSSVTTPGLYIAGATRSKFPFRMPFFDGMLFNDVQVSGDYLVAVTDSGRVYQFQQGMSEPQQTHFPSKIQKCQISRDFVYFLTTKGEILYTPKLNKHIEYDSHKSRNYFGLLKTNQYGKLALDESILQFSAGESHLLMLSKSGKLYMSNTTSLPENYGQYGLPSYSPYSNPDIPVNKPFELTMLNNEIVNNKGTKILVPRKFHGIGTGKYHNIAVDSGDNVWTWGKNSYGECGVDINYKTDCQPLPKRILTKDDYKRICRNVVPRTSRPEDFSVSRVHACNETSFIQLKYKEESILLSFGTGLKGQLGINRYLHVCSQPQIVKTIQGLTEYNEELGEITPINIKAISGSGDHIFVTLDNVGSNKDVLVFGDNEFGQFGNGKNIKSSKPIQLPKLIEPEEIVSNGDNSVLTRRLTDINNYRLLLLDGVKVNGKNIEQVVVAGQDASLIYYKPKAKN